jgi:hypothetical protein
MTLDPWTCADLDRLAIDCAHLGRHKAGSAWHAYAERMGWYQTPTYLPARTHFTAAWRNHRAAYIQEHGLPMPEPRPYSQWYGDAA